MNYPFSKVVNNIKPSFIREILKLTNGNTAISFAGGLPSASLFPIDGIKNAAQRALELNGKEICQYTVTEGHKGLREYIAARFERCNGVKVSPDNILITSGSQQALDLLGKVFLDSGDTVMVESPSYLGAIQAFNFYLPKLVDVNLSENGLDLAQMARIVDQEKPKFFYGIPNFQNPSGMSYSAQNRQDLAKLLQEKSLLMVEDNPYGDLRFESEGKSLYSMCPENVIHLGSFSKIFVPGLRLGWALAAPEIIEKLGIAKQASDLHTNHLAQAILFQYLKDNDLEEHIALITAAYKHRKDVMLQALQDHMPADTHIYPTQGGMFVWIDVPGVNTVDLLPLAIEEGVVYVPGSTFDIEGNSNSQYKMRLNYTAAKNDEEIVEGVKRLARALVRFKA